jgi:hypothetical protein
MNRRRKIVLSLLALTIVPTQSITVPEWRVQFVDVTGKPFASLPVSQTWQNYSVESSAHYADGTTDREGYVAFPERTLWAPVLFRVFGPITSVLFRGGVHAGFGPSSWIVVKCDLLETGPGRVAAYTGRDIPAKIVLKYYDRTSIRKATSMPYDSRCRVPDDQARGLGA